MGNELKTVALLAGGLVAIRAYQLYEVGQKFDFRVKDVRLVRGGLSVDTFAIYLDIDVINPTANSVRVNNLYGSIYSAGTFLGQFNTGKFKVIPGNNPLTLKFVFNNLNLASQLITAIAARKYPVLDFNTVTQVGVFSYPYNAKINTKEYVKI